MLLKFENTNLTFTAVDYKDKVWKNLRDHYVRALNGIKKSGTAVDEAKYPYLEKISFIKKFVNMRTSNAQSNINIDLTNEEGETSSQSLSSPTPKIESDQQVYGGEESDSSLSAPYDSSATSDVIKEDIKHVQKKGTKRPHSRISQKDIDKVLDVKILDYLNSSDNKESPTSSRRW